MYLKINYVLFLSYSIMFKVTNRRTEQVIVSMGQGKSLISQNLISVKHFLF